METITEQMGAEIKDCIRWSQKFARITIGRVESKASLKLKDRISTQLKLTS